MRLSFLILLFIYGCVASPVFAQTYIKGPALIETPASTTTAAGTTTLTKDSQSVQIFTGTLGETAKLPDASLLPEGRYFEFYNQSNQNLLIHDDGSNLIFTVKPNSKVKVVLVDNVSSNGSWATSVSYGTIDASMVTTTPFDDLVSTDTQAMLSELNTKFETIIANLGASDVSYDNSGSGLLATNLQDAVDEIDTTTDYLTLHLKRGTSTGVITGMDLSVNADPTKFNIAAGIYEIADMTDVNNPIITTVTYPGSTANVVTNIGTQIVTYILMNSSGTIVQQATFPTPSQRRQYAFIGRLNHSNLTSITFTNTFPDYKVSPVASFYDLLDAIAPFKIDDGLLVTANGANLSFDRSAGKVFFRSENYTTDKTNPHMKTYGSQTLQPFRKMTQTTTSDVSDVTVLDPANYDNAGTVTAVGGATSRSTIQRVYLFKSGAVRVAYGQTIYNTFPDATAAVGKEMFVVNPTVDQSAVLIALIVLRRNCTSLQDTACALIVPTSRFGGTGGGGGSSGGSVGIEDSSTQTLANAAAVSLQDLQRQSVKLQSTGGVVTVTLPTCTRANQELYVYGVSDANPVIIANTGNVTSNGDITFTNNKLQIYVCDLTNTEWIATSGGF